jgi:cysteine synthase
LTPPVVTDHFGIQVVRDDLFPGGTKARFAGRLFDGAEEVVYASPAEGGAQTALAIIAQQLEKRATIFVAKRRTPHARTLMAKAHGAKVYLVSPPGYLSVVQARARAYCAATGARLAPFGFDLAWSIGAIEEAALSSGVSPEEVWCAGGSGTLARGLAKAWPRTRLNVVQVGRELTVAGATMHKHSLPFGAVARAKPPFPADPHYDAKAFELCLARHGPGKVLFWNVAGPAD